MEKKTGVLSGFLDFVTIYLLMSASALAVSPLKGEAGVVYLIPIIYFLQTPRLKVNGITLFWGIYILMIVVLQDMWYLGGINIKNIVIWTATLIFPVVVVSAMKDRFIDVFVMFMVLASFVSLIFYVLILFIPTIGSFFIQYGKSLDLIDSSYGLFFYTYSRPNPNDPFQIIERLYGPFTEPGMFALFLIVAMYFTYLKKKSYTSPVGILFLVCLILTQSTAGYTSFLLLLIGYVHKSRHRLYAWFLLFLLVVSSIYIYKLPFFQQKIQYDTNIALKYGLDTRSSSRTQQATKSIYAFSRNWLIGAGITYESGQMLKERDISGFSMLDVGRRAGLIGFVLYVFGLFAYISVLHDRYLSYKSMMGTVFILAALSIVMSAQQVSFFRPFILTLVSYGLLNYECYKHLHSKQSDYIGHKNYVGIKPVT